MKQAQGLRDPAPEKTHKWPRTRDKKLGVIILVEMQVKPRDPLPTPWNGWDQSTGGCWGDVGPRNPHMVQPCGKTGGQGLARLNTVATEPRNPTGPRDVTTCSQRPKAEATQTSTKGQMRCVHNEWLRSHEQA